MTYAERRAVAGLAGIFGLRMLGLFLILPVFALYAETLPGHTPLLVGVALGAYGLTQALLQIPFGMLSDRWGRKPVITVGLLIFAAGSVVAALAESIGMVILGRALQGAGAIAAAVLALTADLTREEQRTKAMAVIGISIGAVFMLALIVAPLLDGVIGVPGIFWLTVVLAIAAIAVLWRGVPSPTLLQAHRDVETVPSELLSVLRHPYLLRLDGGIFVLHMVLTAMFVVVPVALAKHAGLATPRHWLVYLPVMVMAVVLMAPLMIISARTGLVPRIFAFAVGIVVASQLLLWWGHQTLAGLVVALTVFFWGFNTLEAMLPSLVSRVAPAVKKGTAIGIYNTFEFLGVFAGGLLGGFLHSRYGVPGVFLGCTVISAVWLLVTVTSPAPRLLDTRLVRVGETDREPAEALARRLSAVPGVEEAIVVAEEGVAYLKVDRRTLDDAKLQEVVS